MSKGQALTYSVLQAQGKYQSKLPSPPLDCEGSALMRLAQPPLPFVLGAEFAGKIASNSPIPKGCRYRPGGMLLSHTQSPPPSTAHRDILTRNRPRIRIRTGCICRIPSGRLEEPLTHAEGSQFRARLCRTPVCHSLPHREPGMGTDKIERIQQVTRV